MFRTDLNGALVDITAKSSAYLPLQEASIHKIKHVEEAGIFPGLQDEFIVVGENEKDDSLILSLRSIQYDLAWERCRQLQAEDVVVKGKVRSLCYYLLRIHHHGTILISSAMASCPCVLKAFYSSGGWVRYFY